MKTPSQPPRSSRFHLKPLLRILACLALAVWMPTPARATDIGPDVYGYVATDNVPYAFEDISLTGTNVTFVPTADDGTATVPIGFAFNFYGVNYTSAGLSPNGLLTFGGVNGQLGNGDLNIQIPTGDLPSVAVFWDDLDARTLGAVYYQTLGTAGARRFIVQWHQIQRYGVAANTVTFQAVLYEANGSLRFQYADVDVGNVSYNFGASATVGIRDTGGQSNGHRLQYSYNLAVVGTTNSSAILFRPTRNTGPDAYGYTASDVGPYAFEDISGSGTAVLAGSDDGTIAVPVGFSFNFYGSNFTTVGLSPNGLLTFGGVNYQNVNIDLRNQATSGDFPSVAVLWDDWYAAPGAVYHQTLGTPGARRFIVQWHQHRHYNGSTAYLVTFQVILYEATQCLKVQFADVDVDAVNGWSWGGSATVAIRDTGGQVSGRVLQWSFDQEMIFNGQSILFSPWGTGKVATFGAAAASYNDDVRNKITARMPNITVDSFLVTSSTPTLTQLLQYKSVLVYSDATFSDATALGNVLADYVDAGGGVVMATFGFNSAPGTGIGGRLLTGGYLPFTTGGNGYVGGMTLVADQPGHLILNGVASLNSGSGGYHNNSISTVAGATQIAHWSNGQPLIAAKGVSLGRVVGLNFYPPSSDALAGGWTASTDGALLLANALKWAGAPTFVVSVFDDPTYVDTSGGTNAESDTVQASLQNRGFTVTTFTDVAAAAAANRILLFPEQENGSLGPALSAAARTALADFVAKGGLMIVHGSSGNTATLLNTVFGFSVVESGQSVTGTAARMAAATGTAFADDPASLPFNNGTCTLTTANLPPGALSIYENAGQSMVALIRYGSGKIIFLGWDWWNAVPTGTLDGGWLQVLASAVTESEPLHPYREIVVNTTDRGWYDDTGHHDPSNDNYIVGDYDSGLQYRNFFVFNVPALTGPVVEAKLRVNSYTIDSPEGTEDYELRAVGTPIATLLAGGSGLTAIYNDLGDGDLYGGRSVAVSEANQFITIPLNSTFIAALPSGGQIALGGKLTSVVPGGSWEDLFSYSFGPPSDVQLVLKLGMTASTIPEFKFQIVWVSANTVKLSWPAVPDNWQLQSSPSLISPVWTAVPDAPVLNAGRKEVVLPATGGQRFFRLWQTPWK